jgi:hypothetical protein
MASDNLTSIKSLKIGDRTAVLSSGRFTGLCVGRDANGFYLCTAANLGRTKSYKMSRDIPTRKAEALKKTIRR